MIDDEGARKLISAILKQAHDDYTKDDSCPEWCQFRNDCESKKINNDGCDAKRFIHSAWCATLCDELGVDHENYVKMCIERHRLSKNTYRYIENEIRLHKAREKELTRLKDDLILSSSVAPEIRGSDVGDPTANKVMRLGLNKQILEMEKVAKAINKIYLSLSGQKKMTMEEYWIGRYTTPGLAGKLGVDETTVRRWKRLIVYSVAIELKYL